MTIGWTGEIFVQSKVYPCALVNGRNINLKQKVGEGVISTEKEPGWPKGFKPMTLLSTVLTTVPTCWNLNNDQQ